MIEAFQDIWYDAFTIKLVLRITHSQNFNALIARLDISVFLLFFPLFSSAVLLMT